MKINQFEDVLKQFDSKFSNMITEWGETSTGEKNMKKELRVIKSFLLAKLEEAYEKGLMKGREEVQDEWDKNI